MIEHTFGFSPIPFSSNEKEKMKNPELSSLSLFLISESYNISTGDKNSVDAIFDRIPFSELKENGINTIEIN